MRTYCTVKAMVFPVVMYGCESWTLKKAEHQIIDAFELWCWRRLLRVPWTARRSNQSILKEVSPGISFEVQFSSVAQSCLTLCDPMNHSTPGSLSITSSRSLPKPVSIESVKPSNHLTFCCPLLLLPSIFPSIRVFSNESTLHMRWPKYWRFSFSIIP